MAILIFYFLFFFNNVKNYEKCVKKHSVSLQKRTIFNPLVTPDLFSCILSDLYEKKYQLHHLTLGCIISLTRKQHREIMLYSKHQSTGGMLSQCKLYFNTCKQVIVDQNEAYLNVIQLL